MSSRGLYAHLDPEEFGDMLRDAGMEEIDSSDNHDDDDDGENQPGSSRVREQPGSGPNPLSPSWVAEINKAVQLQRHDVRHYSYFGDDDEKSLVLDNPLAAMDVESAMRKCMRRSPNSVLTALVASGTITGAADQLQICDNSGKYYSLSDPAGMRLLCDKLGLSNVSVNMDVATAPYQSMLKNMIIPPIHIPTGFCDKMFRYAVKGNESISLSGNNKAEVAVELTLVTVGAEPVNVISYLYFPMFRDVCPLLSINKHLVNFADTNFVYHVGCELLGEEAMMTVMCVMGSVYGRDPTSVGLGSAALFVCGEANSGKTTFVDMITEPLHPDVVQNINSDWYSDETRWTPSILSKSIIKCDDVVMGADQCVSEVFLKTCVQNRTMIVNGVAYSLRPVIVGCTNSWITMEDGMAPTPSTVKRYTVIPVINSKIHHRSLDERKPDDMDAHMGAFVAMCIHMHARHRKTELTYRLPFSLFIPTVALQNTKSVLDVFTYNNILMEERAAEASTLMRKTLCAEPGDKYSDDEIAECSNELSKMVVIVSRQHHLLASLCHMDPDDMSKCLLQRARHSDLVCFKPSHKHMMQPLSSCMDTVDHNCLVTYGCMEQVDYAEMNNIDRTYLAKLANHTSKTFNTAVLREKMRLLAALVAQYSVDQTILRDTPSTTPGVPVGAEEIQTAVISRQLAKGKLDGFTSGIPTAGFHDSEIKHLRTMLKYYKASLNSGAGNPGAFMQSLLHNNNNNVNHGDGDRHPAYVHDMAGASAGSERSAGAPPARNANSALVDGLAALLDSGSDDSDEDNIADYGPGMGDANPDGNDIADDQW